MDCNAGQTLVCGVRGVLLTILRDVAPSLAGRKVLKAMETKYERGIGEGRRQRGDERDRR
ncbi:hypothetical protein E2C01_075003 [Portunus trituberculatus]|uniref:Uncharacterized protein n=1 Tax=Portunus trituberculatus TaxID=210409 RepID=A0A5B7IIR0_PORTR|nr:hypothetical protein [Portunus trituberculatus]